MYVPVQFREERNDVLIEAMRSIQLATLVTFSGGDYHASHVPMVLRQEGESLMLDMHVAKPNPHWTLASESRVPSIAIFQGPQAYVSPSWYPAKKEHGKVVPTWNYIAVHAHGTLEAVTDGEWLAAHLNDLTDHNERSREHPWKVSDAPEDYIRNLSRAIVGLRLHVERIEGSWKMIQHRSEGDRVGTIEGLRASPSSADHAVAEVMQRLDEARVR